MLTVAGVAAATALAAPSKPAAEALRPIPRIVGGAAAPDGAYPFMAALQQWAGNNYLTICGGTLIAPDEVLTAAHCVDQWSVGQLTTDGQPKERIIVGRTVLSADGGAIRVPGAIHVDPAWDSATEADDAAVVRLDSPIAGVDSPTMPTSGNQAYEQAGAPARAIGWGSTQAQGPADVGGGVYPDELQQVDLPVVGDTACQGVFDGVRNPQLYPQEMLCAGGDGRHDACTGDSGGPLLTALPGGTWELIGVTSWGNGCAVPGTPGVFTRLSAPDIHTFVAATSGATDFGP
ncbi:serine protease [Catenulispora sp. NF23]|uniref:Serine protease n=1 Tax=Catenulispora pinistramenti TaxID=2705254 RepID=A0ABS5KMX4_9ACTN|nr:serine protease [Catenulispora pinistramenti]MBS2531932.1 serine protease [Catenulispora pinistramenti]MBS2547411.1 serine protease [Catenulispora pinistramenti]